MIMEAPEKLQKDKEQYIRLLYDADLAGVDGKNTQKGTEKVKCGWLRGSYLFSK